MPGFKDCRLDSSRENSYAMVENGLTHCTHTDHDADRHGFYTQVGKRKHFKSNKSKNDKKENDRESGQENAFPGKMFPQC